MTNWTFPPQSQVVLMTGELANRFYGHCPARSMRGYAVCAGDAPIVLVGVLRDDHRWVLFSDAVPSARGAGNFRARRLALDIARRLASMFEVLRAPVHVMPDPAFAGSNLYLERMGFVPIGQGVLQWRAR